MRRTWWKKDTAKNTGSTVKAALTESKFKPFQDAVAKLHSNGGGKVWIMKQATEAGTLIARKKLQFRPV